MTKFFKYLLIRFLIVFIILVVFKWINSLGDQLELFLPNIDFVVIKIIKSILFPLVIVWGLVLINMVLSLSSFLSNDKHNIRFIDCLNPLQSKFWEIFNDNFEDEIKENRIEDVFVTVFLIILLFVNNNDVLYRYTGVSVEYETDDSFPTSSGLVEKLFVTNKSNFDHYESYARDLIDGDFEIKVKRNNFLFLEAAIFEGYNPRSLVLETNYFSCLFYFLLEYIVFMLMYFFSPIILIAFILKVTLKLS